MRLKRTFIALVAGLITLSLIYLVTQPDMNSVRAQAVTANRPPILVEPGMWISDSDAYFSVTYKDQDNDIGVVTVFVDGVPTELVTYGDDAIEGLYYENDLQAAEVNEDSGL
jgi:hypothetical protein